MGLNLDPSNLLVRIGQAELGCGTMVLKATLGSCVGVALMWHQRGIFGMAHCLLPEGGASVVEIGARYVDQGIRSLLHLMQAGPSDHAQIEAHLAGGANMVHRGPQVHRALRVGELNSEVAQAQLAARGIVVKSCDLGGSMARQMRLDCAMASVEVVLIEGLNVPAGNITYQSRIKKT